MTWGYIIAGIVGAALAFALSWFRMYLLRFRLLEDDGSLARVLHDEMLDAPHDGEDYRHARAALRFMGRWL